MPQAGDATGAVGAVFQGEGAAVVLGDLAAEDEADAGAGGFRREERHEEVPGIGDAGAIVGDSDLKCARDLLGRTPRCDVMEVFLSRS